MIPVNAQIWTERDVARDGISIESVLADIPESAQVVKLVIFDASRRNPFERRFRSAAAGLAPIIAPTNTLLISAGGLGQVVNEGASKQQPVHHRAAQGVPHPGGGPGGGVQPGAHRRVARERGRAGAVGLVHAGAKHLV